MVRNYIPEFMETNKLKFFYVHWLSDYSVDSKEKEYWLKRGDHEIDHKVWKDLQECLTNHKEPLAWPIDYKSLMPERD